MASDNQNPTYLLLFRGNDLHKGVSPAEIQQAVQAMMDWSSRLKEEGKFVAGHPLEHKGMRVSMHSNTISIDGPFAESKEAIGGFFMVKAKDMDEAIAIASQCPMLPYGTTVEVREVAPCCPLARALEIQPELVHQTA